MPQTKILAAIGALALAAVTCARPALALEIDGVFTAFVTSDADPTVWNGAQFGDQITGSFHYDTAFLPPNDPFCASHGRGCYFATNPAHSFLSIHMTLDGVTYDFADDQSTTLDIGDFIQTLPGFQFDQFTAGAVGAVQVTGGGAPGPSVGSAFVQVFPFRQIFTSGDPSQTFAVTEADFHGTSANTATLGGKLLGFSTTSMSDSIAGASAVPEPSGWGLLLAGFAGLGAVIRLRRGRRAAGPVGA
jgi:hypothetical protein